MPLTVWTSTENDNECPVCCRLLREATETSLICSECKIRFFFEVGVISCDYTPSSNSGLLSFLL